MKEVECILNKLKIPSLDIVMIQWPAHFYTLNKPLHVIWPKLELLVSSGLTKSIGVCNFNVQLLMDMLTYCIVPPAVN